MFENKQTRDTFEYQLYTQHSEYLARHVYVVLKYQTDLGNKIIRRRDSRRYV